MTNSTYEEASKIQEANKIELEKSAKKLGFTPEELLELRKDMRDYDKEQG